MAREAVAALKGAGEEEGRVGFEEEEGEEGGGGEEFMIARRTQTQFSG